MHSIDLFIESWCNKSTMTPITGHDIDELESALSIILPDAFKYLISTYGLIHTPNVLTKICDLNSNVSEVQDFLSLEDIYSLSKLYEMTGMPKGHVLFASDCKGNMFCFKSSDCESKTADVPVWFFDQGMLTVTKVSNSFTAWLEAFNKP